MSKKGLKALLVASLVSFPQGVDSPFMLQQHPGSSYHQLDAIQSHVKDQVFLTIDDGPTIYTQEIAEMLSALGHKATFFFVGKNISERHYPAIQQAKSLGHSFGNHSYSHANFRELSLEQAKKQVETTNKCLFDAGIPEIAFFRFPYGNSHQEKEDFDSLLNDMGQMAVNWDIDTRDWDKKTTKADLIQRLEKVKAGDIILIHERPYTTTKTLLVVDSILKAKNLVSEILEKRKTF